MKAFGIAAVLVASVVIGAFLVTATTDEEFVLVKPKVAERVPAALNDTQKLRELERNILKVTHKDKIWEKTLISTLDDVVTVQLPQVALADASGKDNLACLIYGQVTLTFVAEGMATSGEKTTLKMTAPCEFELSRPEVQEVLLVPFAQIQREPARDGVITIGDFPGYQFEVKNLSGEWPVMWLLTEVSYHHANGETLSLKASPGASQEPLPTMIW